MEINIGQIAEGWRNNLIPPKNIASLIEATSEERLKICEECEFNSNRARQLHNYQSIRIDYHCTNCGCTLSAKTKCLTCSCPINKWQAIEKEENE